MVATLSCCFIITSSCGGTVSTTVRFQTHAGYYKTYNPQTFSSALTSLRTTVKRILSYKAPRPLCFEV